jgi:serine/threonine protein kinase
MPNPPEPPLDSSLRALLAGQQVFGRYRLDRVLGQGGMGVVWKAHDGEMNKEVALKFLLEAYARSPDAVSGLKREASRSQDLGHPGIVRIYDLQQDDRHVALSMELVEGHTLAALKCERPGRCFDPADVLPWIEQLGDVLRYAHDEVRVVHRDLKPGNLILTAAGRLKVLDFGIAQRLHHSQSADRTSVSSGYTLGYSSPQQLMGEPARADDDVYSFGATIYDLLTGRPPFFRGKIEMQVLQVTPPTMTERRAELGNTGGPIPTAWEEIVARCLVKERDERPTSARAVADALRSGLHTFVPAIAATRSPTTSRKSIAVPMPEIAPATDDVQDEAEEANRIELPAFSLLQPLRTLVVVLILAALAAATFHWLRRSWNNVPDAMASARDEFRDPAPQNAPPTRTASPSVHSATPHPAGSPAPFKPANIQPAPSLNSSRQP